MLNVCVVVVCGDGEGCGGGGGGGGGEKGCEVTAEIRREYYSSKRYYDACAPHT